ncbi:hypothetical protein D3C76_1437650 [compost metagenome]
MVNVAVSAGLNAAVIGVAVEFRLIVEETRLVAFGGRFEVSMRRSVRIPFWILPLASTP